MSDKHTVDGLMDDDGENRAVRAFLMHYGTPGLTVDRMRENLRLSGFKGFWPEWVNTEPLNAHLTKAGAQDWLRHLFSLESAQRLAAQPGEPVAWRWRCLLKPDYTKYGSWQLTKDPERARAHPGGYGDWPGFQCEPLYASPPPQQGEKEASGVEVFSALDRTLTPDNVRALVQALRNQTQIDEDGTEVGVSREAVDHAASLIERHVLGVPESGHQTFLRSDADGG